jgi:hypothetical protein
MLRLKPRPLERLEGFLHRFQLFNVKMKPLSLSYALSMAQCQFEWSIADSISVCAQWDLRDAGLIIECSLSMAKLTILIH